MEVVVSGTGGQDKTIAMAPVADMRPVESTVQQFVLEGDGDSVVEILVGDLAPGEYVLGAVEDESVVPAVDANDEPIVLALEDADTEPEAPVDETPSTETGQDIPQQAEEKAAEDLDAMSDRLPPLAHELFDADGDNLFEIQQPAQGSTGAGTIPAGLEAYYTQDVDLSHENCVALDLDSSKIPADLECGYVIVPIDADDPERGNTAIAVSRLPATGSSLGPLLWNPGGPGGSGLQYNVRGSDKLGTLRERFDLIGFDPRGVGVSVPFAHCISDERRDELYSQSNIGKTAAEITALDTAEAEEYAADCFSETGRLLGLDDKERVELVKHLGTWDAVGDVDILRSVFGAERLHYVGTSYGTQLGYVYAQKFPDNVGRFVLDGAVNPLPADNGQELSADDKSLIAQGAGFQDAFEQFALQCSAKGTKSLTWQEAYGEGYEPLAGGSGVSLYWDQLKDKPFSCPLGDGISNTQELSENAAAILQSLDAFDEGAGMPTAFSDGRRVTWSSGRQGMVMTLYNQDYWSYLAYALWESTEREEATSLLALADSYRGRDAEGRYDGGDASFTTIRCTDSNASGAQFDQERATKVMEAYYKASPFQRPAVVTGSPGYCDFWPFAGTQPDGEHLIDLPNIMVVSTSHDSATPYASGVELARAVDGTLLTVSGASHGAFGNGVSCVDDTLVDYLVSGATRKEGPFGEAIAPADTAIMPDGSKISLPNQCQIDSFRNSGFALSQGAVIPGQEIDASVRHLESNVPYTITVDGSPVAELETNNGGNATVSFKIPSSLTAGDYETAVVDGDGAVVERLTLTVLDEEIASPSNGVVASLPRHDGGTLAATGSEVSPWLAVVAMLMIAAGIAVPLGRRSLNAHSKR